jgi:ribosomal protein S18 acetylase RimI-like enzyme
VSQSYSIRPATQADAAPLTRLFLDYNAEHNAPFNESAVLDKTPGLLSKCLAEKTHTVHIATIEDSVVGFTVVHWIPFMWLHGTEGYISEMLIHADHRGRGVGNQLMAAVEGGWWRGK